jgi:hypothetical protein
MGICFTRPLNQNPNNHIVQSGLSFFIMMADKFEAGFPGRRHRGKVVWCKSVSVNCFSSLRPPPEWSWTLRARKKLVKGGPSGFSVGLPQNTSIAIANADLFVEIPAWVK